MNNHALFERLIGDIDQKTLARLHTTKLLRSFRAAPHHRFDGGERNGPGSILGPGVAGGGSSRQFWAHQAGVNAMALERFDGRILVSGGSDGTIRLWDLEASGNPHRPHMHHCIGQITKAPSSIHGGSRGRAPAAGGPSLNQHHRFGITHLSFYPFDAEAFLSSSYDQCLKVWATGSAQLSGSFDLGAKVYSHATSPSAPHLLVACATQHPAVRLVDLRSGSALRLLIAPGQIGASAGAVLSLAWAPHREHILASGSTDGTVRIWDIRRSNGLVALLDQEDSLGPVRRRPDLVGAPAAAEIGDGGNNLWQERGIRASAKAHAGPVNGLTWTDDGDFIISAGHDRRIRVWNATTGANTLVNFGPTIRNGGLISVTMFASPTGLTPPRRNLLFWPNESEILVLDLHDGTVVTRLRGWTPASGLTGSTRGSNRGRGGGGGVGSSGDSTSRTRVTSLVWRGAGGFGSSSGRAMGGRNAVGGIYSGHADGQIRAWVPGREGPDDEWGDDGKLDESAADSKRKRKVLDNAYRSLMGKEIRFS